ncbi:NlpC/P60 family protein [Streptomyces sp. 2323.1]|uniref:C40 family peptidase n=1 Tax=Streptomyces sp. 2323.1 TaxID=1938841 RepID=UPI000BB8C1EF|nr:NlpC/P60 family protein [Streptomyces sp. 2323.1]SOE14773.1 NlpC/P60 family protein [Streptomyces sp. 2323.1]
MTAFGVAVLGQLPQPAGVAFLNHDPAQLDGALIPLGRRAPHQLTTHPATAGKDCSGLTQAAYATAGIRLGRTAEAQYNNTPKVPRGQPLHPGYLVFHGRPGHIHHVGRGNNQMSDAPHRGAHVRTENYHWPDYWGATRPTAP